jgi:hypothetical protein
MSLHPLLRKAGDGELPPWARARDDRVSHMERVAGMLEGWARALGSDFLLLLPRLGRPDAVHRRQVAREELKKYTQEAV